jgi:hypothetical protein
MAPQPAEPLVMTVDHPFFSAVGNQQTGIVLFAAAITNPACK